MSSGNAIVVDALAAANITSKFTPAEPEQLNEGFKRLESMLQLWLSKGIVLGTVFTDAIGEDIYEPVEARNAIVDNLAISLAHFYRMPISQELLSNARLGYNDMLLLFQELTIPNKVVSSTLPKGQGNRKGIDAREYFIPGGTVEN